jgi:hypothetical protein
MDEPDGHTSRTGWVWDGEKWAPPIQTTGIAPTSPQYPEPPRIEPYRRPSLISGATTDEKKNSHRLVFGFAGVLIVVMALYIGVRILSRGSLSGAPAAGTTVGSTKTGTAQAVGQPAVWDTAYFSAKAPAEWSQLVYTTPPGSAGASEGGGVWLLHGDSTHTAAYGEIRSTFGNATPYTVADSQGGVTTMKGYTPNSLRAVTMDGENGIEYSTSPSGNSGGVSQVNILVVHNGATYDIFVGSATVRLSDLDSVAASLISTWHWK